MYQMQQHIVNKKWRSCIILSSMLCEIEKFCLNENNGFANPSQFINFAIRKELDRRQKK